MKCKHVQQKMIDYAEHVLNGAAQQQIEQHVHTCRECSQELKAIQGTLELLSSNAKIHEPPEQFWNDFTTDVMRKVRNAEPAAPVGSLFSGWHMRLAMACVLVFMLLAGIYAYRVLRRSSSVMVTQTNETPEDATDPSALDAALQTIVPTELSQDMLDTEFALFDDMESSALEMDSNDTTLDGLLSGMSDEEKRALLLELYKMRKPSQ